MSIGEDGLSRLRTRLESLSDDDLLAELSTLEALPDEAMLEDAPEDSTKWERANTFLVFAQLVRERQLRRGVRLLLDRASYGDPFETMRGLRHSLEAAVAGDWEFLAMTCCEAARSARRGTRLWAIDELGVLRDPATLPVLIGALDDAEDEIRQRAARSLDMLAQHYPVLVESARSQRRQ